MKLVMCKIPSIFIKSKCRVNIVNQKLLVNLTLGFSLFCFNGSANATPVQWTVETGGNGHWYDYVGFSDTGWQSAKESAENSNWLGMIGYLATITSSDENNFIAGIYHGNAYLGATNLTGGWSWITDEVFSYTNWWTGEPNNAPNSVTGENFLMMWHSDGVPSSFATGASNTWNDIFNYDINQSIANNSNGYINGYFVEYSENPNNPSPVPEPTTTFLFSIGLAGLVAARRTKK